MLQLSSILSCRAQKVNMFKLTLCSMKLKEDVWGAEVELHNS
jgi:hypothetical protein